MRLFTFSCATVLICCASAFGEPIPIADVERSNPVSFEKEILPIFQRSCLACHSASEANGELVLETPTALRQGGDNGPAIVPGKGADSLILKLAAHQQESFMPPPDNDVNAPKLTSQELGLLRLWIDQGAKGGPSPGSTSPRPWKSIPKDLGPVYAAALSPDGQYVAATRANRLFIYHVASGQLVGSLDDSSLDPPAAHRDLVQSLAWSSDGTLIASGGFREAKLWEKPLDARAMTFPTKTTSKALAVSPDRQWIAIAGADNTIQLWNTNTSKPGPKLTGHAGTITALRFTSDGKHLFSGSRDKTIRVWKCTDGAQAGLLEVPTPIHAIELIPTVQPTDKLPHPQAVLAAGGDDKILRFWPVPSENSAEAWSMTEVKQLPGHADAITSLAASPKQPMQLYSGSRDGSLRRWDLNNQKQLGQFNHGAPILDIAVRADEQRIASVSENHTLKLWDSAGKQLAEMKGAPRVQQHAALRKQALDANQQRLNIVRQRLTGAEEVLKNRVTAKETADKDVTAADEDLAQKKMALDKLSAEQAKPEPAAEGDQKEKPSDEAKAAKEAAEKGLDDAKSAQRLAVKKQTSAVAAVKITEEAVKIVKQLVDQADAKVKAAQTQFDLASKQASESELPLRSVSFSPDGTKLVTAGDFPSVQIWDAETGKAVGALAKQAGPLFPIAYLDNDRLASPLGSTDVVVWNLNPAWRLRQTIGSAGKEDLIAGRVTSLDFNLETAKLLIGSGLPSRSGELGLFDVKSGNRTHHLPKAHDDVVYCARLSPDGTQIVSGGADKYARLWNLSDQGPLEQFEGHSDYVLGVAWKDDATSVATASSDQTVKIWDVETADQSRTISGFGKDVTGVRFVGTTNHVISSCGDGNARLHDAANGKAIRTFGAGIWLHCADATADEKIIVAGGDDGRLMIWDGTNGKQLHAITVGQ